MRLNWQYFAVGLAVGGVLGFMWGLLNAPYSGAETQQLIAQKVQESVAEGQQAMAAREREMRSVFEQGRRGS